jgi:hypothetical protein
MHFAHGKAIASRTLLHPFVVSQIFRWGNMYDHSDEVVRENMINFAKEKLLGDPRSLLTDKLYRSIWPWTSRARHTSRPRFPLMK